MFNLIQKYAFYVVFAALLVTASAAGVLYVRCGQLNNKVEALTQDLTKVQDANAESQKTITALQLERTKTMRSYGILQQGYNASIEELIRIDGTKGGNYVDQNNEHRRPDDSIPGTGGNSDDLLDALHSLYPGSGGQTGICKAGDPSDPAGAASLPREIRYCFCSVEDVKNLLKNSVLDRADSRDLRTILDGLR